MKKAKREVIRRGDVVRIVNPEFFIRCGYPLSLKDGIKMIMEDEKGLKALCDAVDVILRDDDKDVRDSKSPTGFINMFNSRAFSFGHTSRNFRNIVKILAYYKIRSKNFGGRERRILTKKIEGAKGHDFKVLSKKMVVTGNYIPGSRAGSTPYGDYEAEPPYLDDQKSHMILYLNDGSVDGHFYYVSNAVRPVSIKGTIWSMQEPDLDDIWPLAIERSNIEVVKSNENEI